ncbi:anti-sigma factor [Galactobacter caseinivorans]|uniref:Anti-sigma factor n=1 Tax=Galactobacter caseinivorans TaxID=2676123 RepID=A0A496PM71_9MICC|nr:anti-sigma factor [Galactobacter caseinivorans]RKW71631.1 hypothetical protein DWQ67_01990 [Galactobacter caseinivorans]
MTHPPQHTDEELNGLDLLDEASSPSEPDRGRRRPARWLYLVAALVVIGLGIAALIAINSGTGVAKAEENIAQGVRDAEDMKEVSAKATSGGTVKVAYSKSKNAFAVQLEDFAPAPEGHEYQVSVTENNAAQTFDSAGSLGRDPGSNWTGFPGVETVLSVHINVVAEGEVDPDESDLAQVELPQD